MKATRLVRNFINIPVTCNITVKMCNNIVLPFEICNDAVNQVIEKFNLRNVEVFISAGSEKGDNYIGEIYKIKIILKESNEVAHNLIMKTHPSNENKANLPFDRIYEKESNLYNIILPAFDAFQKEQNIPEDQHFLYAGCLKASTKLILMKDLNVEGYLMRDRYVSFDENHFELSLENLARFHAFSFAMKELNPKEYEDLTLLFGEISLGHCLDAMLKNITTQSAAAIKDEIRSEKLKLFLEDVIDKFHKFSGPDVGKPYNVICHGDTWNNNMLFKYKDDKPKSVIFLDWQASRLSSPVTDLAFLIYCSTDSSLREKYDDGILGILDLYYDALKKSLLNYKCDVEKCYPKHIFDKHIKEIFTFGIFMSLFSIPLILSKKGEEIDLQDMCFIDTPDQKNLTYSMEVLDRLNSMVDDYEKLGLI